MEPILAKTKEGLHRRLYV